MGKTKAKKGIGMIFKPAQLGLARLDAHELEEDKKACRKIGPCGVGKKALYLNSFYIDRRYYLPYGSITRVFKRVAMSSGGFTGKGMFASMAYLVVEYDGGKQKQCNFKDERDVDTLLALLAKEMKIGLLNGGSLGLMALVFLGIYIHVCKHYAWLAAFLISGCVGISLVAAMVISSMVGTLIPMLFHRIHVDPAVASVPLITTVNDLVAVVTYYGLAAIFLIPILAA